MADLALVDELLERRGGLRERRVLIGPVDLVEVDVVHPQRLQALLAAAPQPGRARVAHEAALVVDPLPALGRDHDRIASIASLSSTPPQSPLSCQVPYAIGDTSKPLLPRVTVSMCAPILLVADPMIRTPARL